RVLLEDLARDAELASVRPRPRQARSSRLTHDLAQLAREDEVLAALHARDLDRDDVATDLGHDEPGRGARLVLGLALAVLDPGPNSGCHGCPCRPCRSGAKCTPRWSSRRS